MSKFNTLSLGELRQLCDELLADGHDETTPITFSSNYGDFSRTPQVHSLRANAELMPLEETAYSQSGWAVADEDFDRDEESGEPIEADERPRALVIGWRN